MAQLVQVVLGPGRAGVRVGVVVLVLGQPVLDLRDRQRVPSNQEWFDPHLQTHAKGPARHRPKDHAGRDMPPGRPPGHDLFGPHDAER